MDQVRMKTIYNVTVITNQRQRAVWKVERVSMHNEENLPTISS